MSITLNFPLGDSLREALDRWKEPLCTTRALLVNIVNETLVLHGKPFEASENLANDLEDVVKAMQPGDSCYFVMVKLEEKHFAQVMFIPEGTKPKTKIQYAGSAAHLREESKLAIATDTHVVSLNEVNPQLFGRDVVAERKELMTTDERVKDELSKMEVAPQKPVGVPGVANPLDDAALAAVQDIKAKKLRAASFSVTAKATVVDKTVQYESSAAADWMAIIPEDEPRFVVLNWKDGESIVLLYVCPEGCKPKVKMPYASTKASFVAQLSHQEIQLRKSVETSSGKSADTVIEEHLQAPQLEEEPKPIAPKSIMPKGPRMLI